ncbi:MAG: zf-HC2 domain-containing protein [Clostridiales bacterium]|nr:zf-HC2 domain-containing protein [Clostridiales bacterium]
MSRIPCDVIKDLLPSYTDGIASEETAKLVDEHLAECDECRGALDAMRGEPERTEDDGREIDYLKKNKRRNRRIAAVCVLAACLLVALAAFLKLFVIGSVGDASGMSYIASVEGTKLTSSVSVDGEKRSIKKLEYRELDGVVYVTPRTVVSKLFGKTGLTDEYTAKEEIKKVVFNNVIAYDATTMGRKFSDELTARLVAAWEKWNSLSDMDRMLSSTMPGHGTEYFTEWEAAVSFVGFDVFNPFEDELSLEKMNFVGTDKTGVLHPGDTNLYHARVEWMGEEDGSVTFAEITAGYRVRTFDLYTVSSDQPQIRLVYTVSLTAVGPEAETGSDRLELENGQVVYVRRSSASNYSAIDIFYKLDGLSYTVRLIGGPNDAGSLTSIAGGVLHILFGADYPYEMQKP